MHAWAMITSKVALFVCENTKIGCIANAAIVGRCILWRRSLQYVKHFDHFHLQVPQATTNVHTFVLGSTLRFVLAFIRAGISVVVPAHIAVPNFGEYTAIAMEPAPVPWKRNICPSSKRIIDEP